MKVFSIALRIMAWTGLVILTVIVAIVTGIVRAVPRG